MQLVHYRMENMEKALNSVQKSLADINQGLQSLVRLEEQHAATRDGMARAHARIDDLDDENSKGATRTNAIEVKLAGLSRDVMTHSWALRVIYGTIIVGVITAAIKFS